VSDLLTLFVPNATWRDGPCAEVRVGDHVIRYVRRGTGSSIVVVGGDSDANPAWRELIQSLAARHRVIVTQPPPVGADVSSWLRGFIEGVGLTSIILIAGGAAAEAATDIASADDFTVRKLILLPVDGSTGIDESLSRIEAEVAADDVPTATGSRGSEQLL
jgi:hypothetical protein